MANDKNGLLDDSMLDGIAGGLSARLLGCKNHDWVFTGSYTDSKMGTTWHYFKCLKCSAEKTERV